MKFSTTIASVLSLALGASVANAHGYVQQVTVGGKVYQGWLPFDSPYTTPATQSIVRNIRDDGPVTNVGDAALACNFGGAKAAALTADASAGGTVKFTMNRWPDDHMGPVNVMMANCGSSCDSFDPTTPNSWFKIDQAGLINGKTWATSKLIADGLSWTSTIPENLKGGQYLIRLELIALHSAGAPQFYPSCSQLNVKGSGNGVPSGSDLVSIPGMYKSGDPALFGDIWSNPTSWPQVGPTVAKFISGGSGGDPSTAPASTATSAASTSAAATTAASTTPAGASTTKSASATEKASSTRAPGNPGGSNTSSAKPTQTAKQCKLKKKDSASNKKRALVAHRSAALKRVSELQQQKREREVIEVAERSWASFNKAKSAHGSTR